MQKIPIAKMLMTVKAFDWIGTRTPLVVSVAVTEQCNLKCVHCYAGKKEGAMSVPDFIALVKAFRKMGTEIFMLQGGEPTLHPCLRQMIEIVKFNGAFCSVSTNGQKEIEQTIGADMVSISMEGNEEFHDSIRGKWSYMAAKASAAALVGKQRFMLHCTIGPTSTMENAVIPMLELAYLFKTKVAFEIQSPLAKVGTGADSMHIKDLAKHIRELINSGAPIASADAQWRHVQRWPFWTDQVVYASRDIFQRDLPKCHNGNLCVWVGPDLTLYRCPTKYSQGAGVRARNGDGIQAAWTQLAEDPLCHCIAACSSSTHFDISVAQVKRSMFYGR